MSDNLANQVNGEAMFVSLNENPWHRKGKVVTTEMAGLEFIQTVGLDHEVKTCELMGVVTAGDDAKTAQHPQLGVYRADTGQLFPQAVSPGFEIYQNREIISFFDGLVKDKKIVYECAGALGVGEEVWVLAHIPDLSMSIRGDMNRSYMLIRNGHCGNATLQCFPTLVRVVCANTMASSRAQRRKDGRFGTTKGGYSIRHTKNMREAVSEVQKAYEKVIEDFTSQREMYEFLSGKPVTAANQKEFFRWIALSGKDESKMLELERRQLVGSSNLSRGEKTSLTRFNATIDLLNSLYESETNQQQGTRNTFYSLLQTVYEFVDHARPTRCTEDEDCAGKRFESAIFGSGMALKSAALDQILVLADA